MDATNREDIVCIGFSARPATQVNTSLRRNRSLACLGGKNKLPWETEHADIKFQMQGKNTNKKRKQKKRENRIETTENSPYLNNIAGITLRMLPATQRDHQLFACLRGQYEVLGKAAGLTRSMAVQSTPS